MPRLARTVAPFFPHHVIQRGNNREDVFFAHEDRLVYFSLLTTYSLKWNSPILAYCLMTNHVHLLTRPLKEDSLSKMMQGVTLCYSQYVNRTYGRTGRLWESRYHSCIVDREHYLWAVARYIEQNPVRAKLIEEAEHYPYSSARAHVLAQRDDVLAEELFPEEQRQDYIALLRSGIPETELSSIRSCARTGRPLGDDAFISEMGGRLNRVFTPRPRGRPKRSGTPAS